MHPRLIKISVPKSTLADRDRVSHWLRSQGKESLMPKDRTTADAMRVAIAYVLRDWQTWKGADGTCYKAIAAAPTEQKGLMLDINVQVRKPDGVQYSETICRISGDEKESPSRTGMYREMAFADLYDAMEPWHLKDLGTANLFDLPNCLDHTRRELVVFPAQSVNRPAQVYNKSRSRSLIQKVFWRNPIRDA